MSKDIQSIGLRRFKRSFLISRKIIYTQNHEEREKELAISRSMVKKNHAIRKIGQHPLPSYDFSQACTLKKGTILQFCNMFYLLQT